MSAKWRANRKTVSTNTADASSMPVEAKDLGSGTVTGSDRDDIVGSWVSYDPTYQQFAYYLGGNQPLDNQPTYPVQREIFHPEAEEYMDPTPKMAGQGNDTYNLIDREIGGVKGFVDDQPYSLGVVSSDLVENFWLDGRQAVVRRGRNPSEEGAVGTSDYNGALALQFAQTINQYYPNERSQADLVKAT